MNHCLTIARPARTGDVPSRANRMPFAVRLVLTAVLMVGVAAGPALAHQGATGIVKERMDLMSAVGKANKTLNGMARGRIALDPERIRALSEALTGHARRVPSLFPDTEESRNGKATEALPAIWSRRAEFDAITRDFEAASARLGEVADQGADAVRAQVRELGNTCKACHKTFRVHKH